MSTLSRIAALAVAGLVFALGCRSWASSVILPAQAADRSQAAPRKTSSPNPQKLFEEGEAALKSGDLEKAESDFRRVLTIDPKAFGAYANLGVIYMRRKQWEPALQMLHKAEKLAPQVAGIRLNLGLVYYQQQDFWHAIPPLESVVKDQPDSAQARYLLGICYFSSERWVEAVDTLEPLWPLKSDDLNYLYVLDIAANRAERTQLDERALARMVEVGGDTPEFHLLLGKAKLNLEAYDDAIQELTAATTADPKLTFAHFYLGLAHAKKGDYERARQEFLKDIALEPDVSFNYDELGNVYFQMGRDEDAVKSYQKALQLNQTLNPHLGLAKAYTREAQYDKALAELEAAGKLDPQSSQIHYLRGQVLLKMGRKEEGKEELATSVRMSSEHREKRRQEIEGGPLPYPGLPPSR